MLEFDENFGIIDKGEYILHEPSGSDGKESAYNVGDLSWIPGLGRSPGGEHGNPLQYSCWENPMGRGAWWVTVHGVTKSQTQPSDKHSAECNCLHPEAEGACKSGTCNLILSMWLFSLTLNWTWLHDFIWPNGKLENSEQERPKEPLLHRRTHPFSLHLDSVAAVGRGWN